MDRVSAIMPVYNRERYLDVAIESVLNQTYQNMELIIVDDGSTDRSLAIARNYRSLYPEKIRIVTQENQGPSKARNSAIRIANGNLCAFIDSDDLWSPDKIELQVKMLQRHDDASFIYTGYYVVNEGGDVIRECLPDEGMKGFIHDKLWTVENTISGGTLLVPTHKLIAVGGFDEGLRGAENLDLRIKLSKLGKVYYVNSCLYYYRKHAANLTSELTAMDESRLKLIAKHFSTDSRYDASLYRNVMSEYYHTIGVSNFSRFRLRSALPYFCKAVALSPLKYKNYERLLRCCLGVRINKILSRLKRVGV